MRCSVGFFAESKGICFPQVRGPFAVFVAPASCRLSGGRPARLSGRRDGGATFAGLSNPRRSGCPHPPKSPPHCHPEEAEFFALFVAPASCRLSGGRPARLSGRRDGGATFAGLSNPRRGGCPHPPKSPVHCHPEDAGSPAAFVAPASCRPSGGRPPAYRAAETAAPPCRSVQPTERRVPSPAQIPCPLSS